jgi:hypothetical protein
VVLAVTVVMCVGAPVGYLVWPIVVGTLHADHGEPSPGAALLRFVFTFEDGPDATGVDRLIMPERRAQLDRQRRDYLTAMAADQKATGWSQPVSGSTIGADWTALPVVGELLVVPLTATDDHLRYERDRASRQRLRSQQKGGGSPREA